MELIPALRDASAGGNARPPSGLRDLLLLGAGTAEFIYRPGAPWVQVLAVVFGVGAALTLDEFRCGSASKTCTGAGRAEVR